MRNQKKRIVMMTVVGLLSATVGCTDAEPSQEGESDSDLSEIPANTTVERRVGFVTIPARAVTVPDLKETEISSAEIFYHLMPAQEDAAEKPLIVIFNGGPGAGTSAFLQLTGTGPYTLDAETWMLEETEHPLTEIANLLYIDARQSGFSFSRALPGNEAREPSDHQLFATFNTYTDAADIVLAILGILQEQPALQNANVILMGESYGGVRVQYMLDFLLRPTQLVEGEVYRDDTLLERLKAHFALRFPESAFDDLTPEIIAAQFGWQVLIQPGYLLPDSDGYCNECRCERGDLECPEGASDLDVRKPEGWLSEYTAALPDFLLDAATFETVFGTPPGQIEALIAENRKDAYRLAQDLDSSTAPAAWIAAQGSLGTYDRYYVPTSSAVNSYMFSSMTGEQTGDLLIRNGVWIHTFITRAYFDAATNPDDLPQGMLYTTEAIHPEPLLCDAYLDTEAREGAERPGWAYLTYTEATGIPEERRVEWRMPFYESSGHMVTEDQPTDFFEDVRAFLTEQGAFD